MADGQGMQHVLTKTLVILTICISSVSALCNEMCWAKLQSAQEYIYVGPDMDNQKIPLWSYRKANGFQTDVSFEINNSSEMTVGFPDDYEYLSLPFNLYAIEILDEKNNVVYAEDFTQGCLNPGISVFPANKFQLSKLKFDGAGYLKVYIWGSL